MKSKKSRSIRKEKSIRPNKGVNKKHIKLPKRLRRLIKRIKK